MTPLIRNPDGTITVAEEGDGWVVVKVSQFAEMNPGDTIVSMTNNPDLPITVRRYVPPVPLLPTEPYTVTRVTWADGCSPAEVLTLVGDMWGDYTVGNLSRNITGFEVLTEPRAVTAKAVLDRVRALTAPAELRVGMIPVLVQVADEFGAGS